MPTIRDVVQTLGRRSGVRAVVLLSRDGLTIDAHTGGNVDADGLAALVPDMVAACGRMGASAEHGGFGTAVVEFQNGMVLVTELTADALLAMVFAPDTNVGELLYDLQRHRPAIAGLL